MPLETDSLFLCFYGLTYTNFLQSKFFFISVLVFEVTTTRPAAVPSQAIFPPSMPVPRSINFVNAAGLRPQDSAFVGLSNFPSFDRNHAGKERTHMSFGFF